MALRYKKRSQLHNEDVKPQFEQVQADHEQFLQAFEKPTQVYRYLRSRSLVSPIFLHRNVNYLIGRCSRKKNTRNGFSVNGILAQVESKRKEAHNDHYKSDFMNLKFTGFIHKGSSDVKNVEVEAVLVRLCHTKRKEALPPVTKVNIGKVKIPCNRDVGISPSKAEALAVGSSHFSASNGHAVRCYTLLVCVTCRRKASIANGVCNGDVSDIDEPSPKRRRCSRRSSVTSECESDCEETVLYGGELVVYDENKQCLLTEGDYELVLQDYGSRQVAPRRQESWETVLSGKTVGSIPGVFSKTPTLKFNLSWNTVPIQGTVDSPVPIPRSDEFMANNHVNNNHVNNNHVNNNHVNNIVDREFMSRLENSLTKRTRDGNCSSPKRKRIFYKFQYNNSTQQQTEVRNDLRCPWCAINCLQMYSLLKHIRECHARFTVTYLDHVKGAQIDVCVNESYDGSYIGNPQDLYSHFGYAFSRRGPVQRTSVTQVLVYRPWKPSYDLAEFYDAEDDCRPAKQLTQGHNRLYYHTITCQPVKPQEIDYDSEGENDPDWLRQKTVRLIDEFTDVNEGEKEVMKMWNLHVMHYNVVGDCPLPATCRSFVELNGEQILRNDLCHNFLVHLVNLNDFGLIRRDVVSRTMNQLYRLRHHLESQGLSETDAGSASRATELESQGLSEPDAVSASVTRAAELSGKHKKQNHSTTGPAKGS